MTGYRTGKATIVFSQMPVVLSTASVVGTREGKGPLGELFDVVYDDTTCGETSWEKAESKMLRQAIDVAIARANLAEDQIHVLLAGDLLNQIISAAYAAREYSIPFLGLYGACATFAEAMSMASMVVAGGFADNACIASSSHHDTAERQYRYPTEFGYQRVPTGQWTATAAGAAVLSRSGTGPMVEAVTIGTVQDYGIVDPNDMGSAMAPAFADTVFTHLSDLKRAPEYYDLILSGDLGIVGSEIAMRLLQKKGMNARRVHKDSGLLIYQMREEIGAGASGCGCIASVFCAKIFRELRSGALKRVLIVATGALHSPTSVQQGESIPTIAHAVSLISPHGGGSK